MGGYDLLETVDGGITKSNQYEQSRLDCIR